MSLVLKLREIQVWFWTFMLIDFIYSVNVTGYTTI